MDGNGIKTAAIPPSVLYKFMLMGFFAIAIYTAGVSMAYATGTNTPMGYVLCYVVSFIYGNLGRGLATMAIIIIGVGATLGKVSWGLAITVGIGIAVIFNATVIMNAVVSNSGFGAAAIGC